MSKKILSPAAELLNKLLNCYHCLPIALQILYPLNSSAFNNSDTGKPSPTTKYKHLWEKPHEDSEQAQEPNQLSAKQSRGKMKTRNAKPLMFLPSEYWPRFMETHKTSFQILLQLWHQGLSPVNLKGQKVSEKQSRSNSQVTAATEEQHAAKDSTSKPSSSQALREVNRTIENRRQ